MEHMSMKWTKLAAMAVISFVAMYALMYLMVDSFSNVYLNVNQLYMVASMTAAMMLIEIMVMQAMYQRRVKRVTVGISVIVLVLSIIFIRGQIGVTDKEFIKSMIPHHASALLMCEKANLNDPDIKKLCAEIISGQQSQIDWMRTKLQVLE